MRENMTFLTNYYQIREMTIDRMKEIIDQNKNAKEGGTVFFGDSITQFMDIEKYFPEINIIVVLVELLPQCYFILLMKEF